MIASCFFAFLALASAAPQYGYHGHQEHRQFMRGPPPPPPPPPRDDSLEEYFRGPIFDTQNFWQEMAAELHKFDQILTQFYEHFPASSSDTGIKGNEYVVTMNLNGFEEKDIKVKAREGVLMVQAIHKSVDGSERSYTDLKTLPTYVNVKGTWTFEMGVLKIVFPLNRRPVVATESTVTEAETQGPSTENRDREEMEPTESENVNHDADVGLERGDKDTEILTNVIPSGSPVEATTYAVDLKNEVEFVPVRY